MTVLGSRDQNPAGATQRLLTVLLSLAVAGQCGAYYVDVSVTDYGAVPNAAESLCTEAFKNAVADISKAGGGILRVPAGTFFTGPIRLTSHMVLWLAEGATLMADTDRQRLPLLPAVASYGPDPMPTDIADPRKKQADLRDAIPRAPPLLHGVDLENVTITGNNGTLDGQGADWWERWLVEPLDGRPHLVQFEKSTNIRMFNVTLVNPGFWAVHLWLCQHVHVRFLTILVLPWDPPVRPTNSDGVNPDSSSHILIEDSYFQTGDDAVAIKSGWDCFGREVGVPSKNITVRRVTVRQTKGCNAAGVAIGSEMSGGVDGVLIEDSHFVNTGAALEVKVGTGGGGYVRNIHFRNINIGQTARGAIVVMAVYPEPNPFCHEVSPPAPDVTNVTFEKIHIEGPTNGRLVELKGTKEVFLNNISVSDVTSESYGYQAWSCSLVSGVGIRNQPRECLALRQGGSIEDLAAERQYDSSLPKWVQSWFNSDPEPRPRPRPRPQPAPSSPQAGWLSGKVWRSDGRCGFDYRNDEGQPGACPTEAEFQAEEGAPERKGAEPWLSNAPCCATSGWCGSADSHCFCYGCLDFRDTNNRESRLSAEELRRRKRDAAFHSDTDSRTDAMLRYRARQQRPESQPTLRDRQESRWWQSAENTRSWRRPQQAAATPTTPPQVKRASRVRNGQQSGLSSVATSPTPSREVPVPSPSDALGGHAVEPGEQNAVPEFPQASPDLADDAENMASRAQELVEPPVRGLITSLMFALCVFLCGLLVRRYIPAARKHCLCLGGLICLAATPYLSILWHTFSSDLAVDEVVNQTKRPGQGRLQIGRQQKAWVRISANAACEVNREGIPVMSGNKGYRISSCKSACKAKPTCVAIDFYDASGWCNFYNTACTTPLSSHDGAMSYKLQAVVPKSQSAKALAQRSISAGRATSAPRDEGKAAADGATHSGATGSGATGQQIQTAVAPLSLTGNDCWPKNEVTPMDFGAVGDGRADDTDAIRSCLVYVNRCHGTDAVIGPAGRQFLVRPGELHVKLQNLRVRFDGEIIGPSLRQWNPDLDVWPAGSCAYGESGCTEGKGQSPEIVRSQWTLLHFINSDNITIEGPGGIRAPGRSFWTVRNRRPEVRGYCLFKLERSTDVRLSGLAFTDSPMYHVVIIHSSNIDLKGLSIVVNDETVGEQGPHNTDGVSIVASFDVHLHDSEIESGDDNVVIKEGSRRVLAENLLLYRGKGVSIGSLGERAAGDQVVTDIMFRNVSLDWSLHGARIKTWIGARGLVKNVTFEEFNMEHVAYGILIDQQYCPVSQRPEGCMREGEDVHAVDAISIQDVRFRNFSGTYLREDRKVACVRCTSVTFRNFKMERSPHAPAPRPRSRYSYEYNDAPAPTPRRHYSSYDR